VAEAKQYGEIPDVIRSVQQLASQGSSGGEQQHTPSSSNNPLLLKMQLDGSASEPPTSTGVLRRFQDCLLKMLVHCADLSGQALDTDLAQEWGIKVMQEFQQQSQKEEEKGLPLTPIMKGLEDPARQHQEQLGFIQFVVLPLFQTMSAILPELKDLLPKIEANMAKHK
jgi:hypothetical protein